MSTKLRAYKAHPEIPKAVFVRAIEAHGEADAFVQRTYNMIGVDSFRGCAVGCSLETVRRRTGDHTIDYGDHGAYETYLGIPRILARLEDSIFEGLPFSDAQAWPLRFSQAISEGADLSGVWDQFCPWMLREIVLPSVSDKFPDVRDAIKRVIRGYDTAWRDDDAASAASAAYAAARVAANAAYAAYAAADAAYAAANAADAAYVTANAADAAYVTAFAADAAKAAARVATNAYRKMADKLCVLLAAAPVHAGATDQSEARDEYP